MVAKKWISLLIEFMLTRFLFVDVPVTGIFSESCTPNGTFWEFSQIKIKKFRKPMRTYLKNPFPREGTHKHHR